MYLCIEAENGFYLWRPRGLNKINQEKEGLARQMYFSALRQLQTKELDYQWACQESRQKLQGKKPVHSDKLSVYCIKMEEFTLATIMWLA